MLDRLFLAHPRSVGETYAEHLQVASRFSRELIGAGLMCLVHGVVPCLFEHSASARVRRLHDDMVLHRLRAPAGAAARQTVEP